MVIHGLESLIVFKRVREGKVELTFLSGVFGK